MSVCVADCLYINSEGKLAVRTDNETIKCVDDGNGRGMLQAVKTTNTVTNNDLILDPSGGLTIGNNGLKIKLDSNAACNDLQLSSNGLLMNHKVVQLNAFSQSSVTYLDNIPNVTSGTTFTPPELTARINFTTPNCNVNTVLFAIVTFGAIEWSLVADNEPVWVDQVDLKINGAIVEGQFQQTNIDSRGVSGSYYQGGNPKMVHSITRQLPRNSNIEILATSFLRADPGGVGINNSPGPNYLRHGQTKIDMITILDDRND